MSDPGALMPADDAGADMPAAGDDAGSDSTVVATICKDADGTYTVYAGEKPAAPEEGAEPGSNGTPAESVGAALKAVLDVLKADESGAEGSPDDNFAAGFDGGSNASPPKAPPAAPKY